MFIFVAVFLDAAPLETYVTLPRAIVRRVERQINGIRFSEFLLSVIEISIVTATRREQPREQQPSEMLIVERGVLVGIGLAALQCERGIRLHLAPSPGRGVLTCRHHSS